MPVKHQVPANSSTCQPAKLFPQCLGLCLQLLYNWSGVQCLSCGINHSCFDSACRLHLAQDTAVLFMLGGADMVVTLVMALVTLII